jgi:hypothetical protein
MVDLWTKVLSAGTHKSKEAADHDGAAPNGVAAVVAISQVVS